MPLLTILLGIPLQLYKIPVGPSKIGVTQMKLKRERAELGDLIKFRDMQRNDLSVAPASHVDCVPGRITYRIEESESEKAIVVPFAIYNLTLFDINCLNWACSTYVEGKVLVQANNVDGFPALLNRCQKRGANLVQPISDQTAARIRELIEQYRPIQWRFTFRVDATVEGEPLQTPLSWDLNVIDRGE